MSTLSTEERAALDEIFLSMAGSPSPFRSVTCFIGTLSQSLRMETISRGTKKITKAYPVRKSLRSARMFLRTGYKTCATRFRFKR